MTLSAIEFLRRLLLHVLPDGFQRIRYFGLLANRQRREALVLCRELLNLASPQTRPDDLSYRERLRQLTGRDILQCPSCKLARWSESTNLLAAASV
jgi:hypothetical protein